MDNKTLALLGVLFIGLFTASNQFMKKRGIRNNNPGNIKHSNDKWIGAAAVQDDPMFVKFISPEYGIRAMYKNLLTYRNKYGLNTIRGIIMRWAKKDVHGEVPYENYFKFLEKNIGLDRNAVIPLEKYPLLIDSIIKFENGSNPYSIGQIQAGVSLA